MIENPYTKGPYRAVWQYGWQASVDNKMRADNPYHLTSGRSRQFANAWLRGFEAHLYRPLCAEAK